MDIHVRFTQGQSLRKIARELGISRNTVKHHLQQQAMPTYAKRSQQPSKLAPFKPYLLQRIELAKPDWIPATVLFDEVAERGYQGGIAQLRRFVCQLNQALFPKLSSVLKHSQVNKCKSTSPASGEVKNP